jgi:hypothetical protein
MRFILAILPPAILRISAFAVALACSSAWAAESPSDGSSPSASTAADAAESEGKSSADLSSPPVPVTEDRYEEPGAPRSRGSARYVDPEGKIYRDRRYHGIVPGLRHMFRPGQLERLKKRDLVSWTGFQPMAETSRVFWQLTKPAPEFEVVKVDAKTIRVVLPGSRPARRNHLRPLVMTGFDTPVERVEARRKGRGTMFVITLREPADFLYRFEAPFLYLDIEHGGGGASPAAGGGGDAGG